MTERAERINGWAAMLGVVAAMGSYAATGQIILAFGDVSFCSINGCRIRRRFTSKSDDDDDSDGPDGGILTPIAIPT